MTSFFLLEMNIVIVNKLKTEERMSKLIQKFFNSSFWFHVYYKHTKKHKKELSDVTRRVLEIRKRAIGK